MDNQNSHFVILPVPIGQKIFFLPYQSIACTTVESYTINQKGIYMRLKGFGNYPIEMLGKIFFLTKQEALNHIKMQREGIKTTNECVKNNF